jgi:hypothetical protein
MSKTDQYSRRIANYLYKDLEGQEKLAFEADLKLDPDLAYEFNRQAEMVDYFKSKVVLDEMERSSDMDEAERLVKEFYASKDVQIKEEDPHADTKPVMEKRKTLRRIIYPLMAAAAVLVGVLIIRNESPALISSSLYSSYYAPLEDVNFTNRGTGTVEFVGFQDALNQYLNGAYASSSRLLAEVGAMYPDFAEAQLFYGLSLMGDAQYAASTKVFESFLSEFEKYEAEAKWYLALCYLKLERIPEAGDLMSELANQEGSLGKDAAKISKRLSAFK